MYSLYFVARAYEKDAKLVLQCIESGKLWSGMERDDAKELLNFVETGDEIAVEDLPQSQQVRVKRERILPQMEDVIRRRLFASCTDMDDKTIAIILSALMNHAPFFDAIQELRKQYGDHDFFHTLMRWDEMYSRIEREENKDEE